MLKELKEYEHIKSRCITNDKYVEQLVGMIKDEDTKLFIRNKLLAFSYSENQYLEAVTEVVWYLYLKEKNYNVSSDVKVNPENTKNVDIVAQHNNQILHLEMKTPKIEKKNAHKFFYLGMSRRYSQIDKNLADTTCKNLVATFEEQGLTIKKKKIMENNLKDYVLQSQAKFVEGQNTNILVIGLLTNSIADFLTYIINPDTGFATTNAILEMSQYDKIDYILLTNVISGHLLDITQDFTNSFNVWDISNYIKFLIPIKSISTQSQADNYSNLIELFESEFYEFANFENSLLKENSLYSKVDDMHMRFGAYLNKKHPNFLTELQKGKYASGITEYN